MSSKSPDYREPWSQKHILAQAWEICRIPKLLLHSPLDASHPHNVTFPRKGESLHPMMGKKPREARSGDLTLARAVELLRRLRVVANPGFREVFICEWFNQWDEFLSGKQGGDPGIWREHLRAILDEEEKASLDLIRDLDPIPAPARGKTVTTSKSRFGDLLKRRLHF